MEPLLNTKSISPDHTKKKCDEESHNRAVFHIVLSNNKVIFTKYNIKMGIIKSTTKQQHEESVNLLNDNQKLSAKAKSVWQHINFDTI